MAAALMHLSDKGAKAEAVVSAIDRQLELIRHDVPTFKETFTNIELVVDDHWHYDKSTLSWGNFEDGMVSIHCDRDCYALYIGTSFSIVTARRTGCSQTLAATYILRNKHRRFALPKECA